MRRKGIALGDIHFPFHHKMVLAIALYLTIKAKPDYIVQVGDLYDRYSAASFPRSFNVFTPKDEMSWSRYYAECMWQALIKHLPNTEMHQILGNHCVRPIKRIMEVAPAFEEEMLEALQEQYEFEGVKTTFDTREVLLIDDVGFNHGYLSRLGAHSDYTHMNFVCGHTHRGGCVYRPLEGHLEKITWEANAGYLADPYAKGLSYTALRKATNWTHGILEIDLRGPKFIPINPAMELEFFEDPLFKELCF
jgi:predicted phosphodiesterase